MCDKSKSKAISITGCGDIEGYEMLRIPHCLYNRLTDGSKVVSPMHWPCSNFCWMLSKPQGLVQPEGLGKFKKTIHLIGS
jgi:hypothetical protein